MPCVYMCGPEMKTTRFSTFTYRERRVSGLAVVSGVVCGVMCTERGVSVCTVCVYKCTLQNEWGGLIGRDGGGRWRVVPDGVVVVEGGNKRRDLRSLRASETSIPRRERGGNQSRA